VPIFAEIWSYSALQVQEISASDDDGERSSIELSYVIEIVDSDAEK
jgi:hypothetical protein